MKQPKFCSSCRHSKYVFTGGQRKLYCKQREAFGLSPYIPTNCTHAQTCLDFDPENWRTNLNTRSNYSHMMKKCNIPLEEEENGILAQEKLT